MAKPIDHNRLLDTVADVVKLGLAGTVIVLVAWFVRGQKTTLTLSGVNSAVVTGVVAGPFLFLWRRAAKKNSQQTGELRKLRIRTDRWELEALARKQGSESDETESDDPKEGSNES